MITTTWTNAPADLLGTGGVDARVCTGSGMPFGGAMVPTLVPVQGTGVPAVGTAARLRPAAGIGMTTGFGTGIEATDHNQIGTKNDATTLGICSSRRPQS